MVPVLEKLAEIALEAGKTILELRTTHLRVSTKVDKSPVTEADCAAESIILKRLALLSPEIPAVAEEEAAAGRIPRTGSRFFLIDPLDGTQAFIRGEPDFTVNIALIENHQPLLGVVYAPAHGRLFAGDVARLAAWHANVDPMGGMGTPQPIQARRAPAEGLIVVTSRSHRSPATETYLKDLSAHQPIARMDAIGSSFKFCLIAAGEADLYPRFGATMEWDTAAGQALLLAAGGEVVTPEGEPLRYAKPFWRNGAFIARGPRRSK